MLSSQFTVNYSTWSRRRPLEAFDTSIPWTENSTFVSFHVHAEDSLSHWLLITVTRRRSRRRDCCQADFVQVDGVQSGTTTPRPCKAKRKRGRWPEKSSRLRLLFILRWWSTSPLISLRPFAHWCVHLFMGVSDHSLTGPLLSHLHSFTSSVSAWHDPSEMEHFLWHLAFSPKPLNVCHINLSLRSAQRFVASALWLMTFRCVQINTPTLLVMYDAQTNPDS